MSTRGFADLTDVTLADEDQPNSSNRAIQDNVAMQVMQLGDQCKLCNMVIMPIGQSKAMWCHLMAKFGTNASFAIWWPNLELRQCGAI